MRPLNRREGPTLRRLEANPVRGFPPRSRGRRRLVATPTKAGHPLPESAPRSCPQACSAGSRAPEPRLGRARSA